MKVTSSVFALFVVLGAFLCNPLKAEATPCKSTQKLYVKTDQITIDKDVILIRLSQGVFGTTHLEKDARGYYVHVNDLYAHKGHSRSYRYFCAECKRYATDDETLWNAHIQWGVGCRNTYDRFGRRYRKG